MRRLHARLATTVLAGALAACGGEGVPEIVEEVPVAEAAPVPFEESGLAAPSPAAVDVEVAADDAETEADDADASASPSPSPTRTVGPSAADAAAFVRGDALADLASLEHVVVDLDGDGWGEVVAAGILDRGGVVRVAWWTAEGYEVLAEDVAGPGRDVADLRVADLTRDGRDELLVAVEGEGLRSLALWTVPRRGVLERLEAVGGCVDGEHVYGVTRARLEDRGEAPPAVVADCDDSPLPVADWAERTWEWQDGAYRLVEEETEQKQEPGDKGKGDENGNGDPGGGRDDDEDDD